MRFKLIYLYITREFLLSFLVAFLFFFFIFFINQILVLAEEIFAKHIPFADVMRFILYSLPAIVALAFPFGSLVGSLMAIGRLSSDNEVLAVKALGLTLYRLFLPLAVLGIVFSLISFVANDYFLPLGNIRLAGIYRRILYSHPEIELEPYSVKKYENTVIVTGGVEGRSIRDILIIDRDADNRKRIITARRASLLENGGQRDAVSLRLEEAFSQVSGRDGDEPMEYTQSEAMIYNLLLKDIQVSIMNPGPREMSSVDVWRDIRQKEMDLDRRREEQLEKARRLVYDLVMEIRSAAALDPEPSSRKEARLSRLDQALQQIRDLEKRPPEDRNLQIYRLEFYKKFSFPASCLIFIAFAFPVGLYTRRSGRTVGFGIGLLMASLYWGLLFTGHTLGVRLEVPPFLAMWLPNLLVLLAAAILMLHRLRQ